MKVLIANRGEVACRIIHAVHELGLKAALVVSEQDACSPAARLADDVALLKGTTLKQTYLNGEAVLAAARSLSANLVHPGFGFLSEDADFARSVGKAGLVWIGPDPASMDLVSNKFEAKKLASKLKVPTAGWKELSASASEKDIAKAGAHVGFPCLVKAAAGGGGKGLKRVDRAEDLLEAVRSAEREALAAFGAGGVFVEALVENARHLEIQAFGDAKGVVHTFGERDCSLQRRFQKVIEESPSPHLSGKARETLEAYAKSIMTAAKYRNAGTVEFLMDQNGDVYFMEVNTRLQVEHGVTEERYGIDLVKMQILTALGKPIEPVMTDCAPRGHVLELRLYAEDAFLNFLPQPGKLWEVQFPSVKGLRVESGIESGGEITGDYDPMIAKLLVTAATRDESIDKAIHVLRQTVILGPTTNRDFLLEMLAHPTFRAGNVTTQFLSAYAPTLATATKRDLALAIAKALGSSTYAPQAGIVSESRASLFSEIAYGRFSS